MIPERSPVSTGTAPFPAFANVATAPAATMPSWPKPSQTCAPLARSGTKLEIAPPTVSCTRSQAFAMRSALACWVVAYASAWPPNFASTAAMTSCASEPFLTTTPYRPSTRMFSSVTLPTSLEAV